jgi:hypothetical protein
MTTQVSVTHWVLLVMDVYTRRIVGFGVQAMTVDGPSLCRMFNKAIAGQSYSYGSRLYLHGR